MPAEAAVPVSDVEIRTLGKLRRRIIPLLVLLYVVAYVDRINIGFAALTMNAALGITSSQFGVLAGIFFWGYFIFEVPSNLLLHRVGACMWIGRILVTWGIVAMAAGAVQNVHQFYVARFLPGVAEAGFFPGIILYLTYWFRQRDQAHVISLFVTALPVASILGAPVSGFILDHAHWAHHLRGNAHLIDLRCCHSLIRPHRPRPNFGYQSLTGHCRVPDSVTPLIIW